MLPFDLLTPDVLYIDATAGGMLVQVLLGGFAGLAVVGRLVWHRISPFSHSAPPDGEGSHADDEPER